MIKKDSFSYQTKIGEVLIPIEKDAHVYTMSWMLMNNVSTEDMTSIYLLKEMLRINGKNKYKEDYKKIKDALHLELTKFKVKYS